MTIAGILIGLLNCILLAAVLVLAGAIVAWIADAFGWGIPGNIQRVFMLIVLLIFVICVVGLLLGSPMVHFFGRTGLVTPANAQVRRPGPSLPIGWAAGAGGAAAHALFRLEGAPVAPEG